KATADAKPKLGITKSASPAEYKAVGDEIKYTIVATNEGNVLLKGVEVTDTGTPSLAQLENLDCKPSNPADLEPGKSIKCTGTYKVTQADLNAGKIEDTACAKATWATAVCEKSKATADAKPKLG